MWFSKTLKRSIFKWKHQTRFRGEKAEWKTQNSYFSAYSSLVADSYYNEEHKRVQATVAKIIERDILHNVDKWEAEEKVPLHEIIKKFGDASLLGIRFDPEFGGSGLDYKYQAAYLEELGSIPAAGVAAGIIGHTEITLPSLAKQEIENAALTKFLQRSLPYPETLCLVWEFRSGSDVAGIKTSAVRSGSSEDLIIRGTKMWTTNGLQADWMCLLAITSQHPHPHKNKSLICVPLNSNGVSRTKIDKLGWHSSDTAQIFFDDVRVPCKYIIGEEGMGFMYQMLQFQEERLGMSLVTLRALDRAISDTIEYTRERKAFGRSILDNQVVNFRLAELASEVEALRALTYRAVDMMANGENVTRMASMAKLKAGRLSRIVADSLLQYFGGMGYTRDIFISRFFRDGRLTSIGGGADEIMLEIISKLMGISAQRKTKSD